MEVTSKSKILKIDAPKTSMRARFYAQAYYFSELAWERQTVMTGLTNDTIAVGEDVNNGAAPVKSNNVMPVGLEDVPVARA